MQPCSTESPITREKTLIEFLSRHEALGVAVTWQYSLSTKTYSLKIVFI
jgi:hypothetical protein